MNPLAGKRVQVIMVEDDIDLCSGWEDVFALIGHDIKCYQRAADALNDPNSINLADLLISDFYLPDINGVEVIKKVREINPSLRAILLTGSRDSAVLEAAKKLSNCSILHKPVNIEEIEVKLDEILISGTHP